MAAKLNLNIIAEELSEIRSKIAEIKEGELARLEEQEETLREALVKELKAKGMKSVNSELTNELYTRAERFTLKIDKPEIAQKWAVEAGYYKVDTSAALKYFRQPNAEMPEKQGFVVNCTEYLSIRKQNGNNTSEN